NVNQSNEAIKRHASPNETDFFRGLAGALKFNNLQINLFYSHRKQDANADSATIYTFKTDGYNRIPNDINKRKTATVDMGGSHIRWRNEAFNLGLTFVYYSFGGKELNPDPKPYNLFYLRGKSYFNSGMNYSFKAKRFSFKGEAALDADGKWATVNNLLLNPASSVNLIFSYRNYARDYNAFYAKAFSESSGVRNENGFYMGVKLHPFRQWELSAYVDYFRFPWLRYGVNSSSSGRDGLVQVNYKPSEDWQMQLRYKYKEKEKNVIQENGNHTFILPYQQQRWQFRFDYRHSSLELKTQADYNLYTDDSQSQPGWSLTQTFGFAPDKSKFRIDGSLGYFHANDWNSRISIYEKNILYAFYYPSFSGEGLRFYTVVKWKIAPSLTIYLKLANTRYFDRDVIGSDLEEIQGRDKTDVYCLLKYEF
ncbi:MAG: helix-hairpin-helix domain-containing protein, partial [Dysgonamonadaceae bacterium]|nr:helix-hairpin-helix domain-containing protein [Dysgonamonadaceae bacterium]